MLFLLTGDDGINSPGLLAQKKALERFGEVIIIAPKTNMSWGSKRISHHPIRWEKCKLSDGSEAIMIDGYPADAVHIGVEEFSPDVVVSGVNIGANFAISFFLSSATCGAALEAAILGIPAITTSLHTLDFSLNHSINEFKYPALYGAILASNAKNQKVQIISIVSPPNGKDFEIAKIANKSYPSLYYKKGNFYYFRSFIATAEGTSEDSDIYIVVKKKKTAIVPISLNFLPDSKTMAMEKKRIEDLLKPITEIFI